jgi:hypothetical protein
MRTAVRVRLGALVAGATLGALVLAGQASAQVPPIYGVGSPTPVTVSVPPSITFTGLGGPLTFGPVSPGGSVDSGPLVQIIQTNSATGYGFFADWTGFTSPTPSPSPPVLSLRLDAIPAAADLIGPPPSSYALGVFSSVPTGQSQIAFVHGPTSAAGDTFQDTARVSIPSGGTSGDYTGTLTFNAYTLP